MVILVSAVGWGIGRFRVGADVSLLVLAALTMAPAGLGTVGDEFRRPAWSHPP